MGAIPVLGDAPVTVIDSSGKQLSIPLSLLSYGAGGVQATNWPAYAANKALLDPWLAALAGRNLLRPGVAPAAAPAFQIAARDAGAGGNLVTVEFANVAPNAASPDKTKADVTVSVSETYAGLTVASAATVLGVGANGATKPGLAYLKVAPADLPAAGEADFSGSPASWDVPKSGGGTAFTLLARHDEPDAAKLHGKVSAVDTGAGTFTLALSWAKTKAGVMLKDLQSTFGFVLVVTAPAAGFAAPKAGVVTLAGGSDPTATAAAPAQATVLSA